MLTDDDLDEDLREWRQQIAEYKSHGDLRSLVFPGPCVARIIARLDAAESRAEELQRNLEQERAEHAETIRVMREERF